MGWKPVLMYWKDGWVEQGNHVDPLLVCKGSCGHVTSLHGGLTEAETQLETAVDTHSQVETEVDTVLR